MPEELPEVVRQMLRREFYPHPTSTDIRLVQTHISYVLLTGSYAYKVKKAVDLGFLDFSTLQRRRHFCEEELRLNARGAPGLYLDVLAITREGDRLQLGGSGTPVEYSLRMRQFTQECVARAMLERGTLRDEDIVRLARAVALFHGGAATGERISSFGAPEKLAETFEANYRATERFVGGDQTAAQLEETRRFTARFLAERRHVLLSRARGGYVREGHGDLHLNNVCFWQGRVLLFDCIEFNEAFRYVDTFYDVAFAAMDFDSLGQPEMGNLFLNVYCEQTGDWDGIRILPLYLCRQAYVRAMVNSILAEELAGDQAASRAAAAEAALYYRQAWQYTRPRHGRFVLMCGLSGSGKSTTARALAKRLRAIHIRSDAVRKHLAGVPLDQTGGPELYTEEMTRRTYARLLELAATLAAEGSTVILDAKFDRVAQRAEAMSVAGRQRVPFLILHCSAPHDVLRKRLGSRMGDIADATPDLLVQQQSRWESFTEAETPFVKVLDTAQAADEVEAAAAEACQTHVVRRSGLG